jgi:toxin-antitoxin system PIN domain toxin
MKLVDANILLYAVDEDAPLHRKAKAWLEGALSGTETVGFEWTVLLAFLRLSTRAAVFPHPLRLHDALALIDSWLSQPCAVVVQPSERPLEVLREMLAPFGTAGNLTSDAHLAAVAREHGAELCSCDADFARFPGVRWVNPLA